MASNILKAGQKAVKQPFAEPLMAAGIETAKGILSRKVPQEELPTSKPKKPAEVKNALEGRASLLKKIFGADSLVSLQKTLDPMVNEKVVQHVPGYLQHLGLLYRAHNYPRRGMYSKLLTTLCIGNSLEITNERIADICTCYEMMNLGFYIMEHLDSPQELLSGIPMGSLMAEKFNKKNFILASDFFYASA